MNTHMKTPVDPSYSSCEQCSTSLWILSPSTTPDVWTKQLGIQPSQENYKGSSKTNSLGRTRIIKTNGWFLESEGKVHSKDLRDHLDFILEIAHPKQDVLLSLQGEKHLLMGITCSWWGAMHCGPTLWPRQLQKIAELNLELEFMFASYTDEIS
ncbi:MAG: DUF4279 domain-containing protein [Zetaproteobacteria bacterium]|nr:DUF4279 domain-containing protein [Zetaproteobacteria bacterium]